MNYYSMDIPCMLGYGRQVPASGGMGMMQPYPSTQLPATGTPQLPTGFPTGPSLYPMPMPSAGSVPAGAGGGELIPAPETVQSTEFVAGYLKTQIGRNVRVEFLIGTNGPMVDRIGTLVGVGASYILIRPTDTDDVLLCDLYSIKFVTFYY